MSARDGQTSRRGFLKGAAAAAGAAVYLPAVAAAEPDRAAMPMRTFGKTDCKVSLFGLGCYPLGALRDPDEGSALVVRALDGGCNYIDTAPSYKNGNSERRVGNALRQRKRSDVFLATKTLERTADGARRELEQSLKRLKVDAVDLIQIHAVRTESDLARVLDLKRGPLPGLLKAKEEKLVRFIGVTGHTDPTVMRKTFEGWGFDSILFPLNCVDPNHRTKTDPPERLSFVEETLPAAVKNGLARVAMKVFASGRLPKKGISAEQCLRYTYGLDIATCTVGCKTEAEVDLALGVAKAFKPLSAEASKALVESTRPYRGKSTEWYKRA